MQVIQKEELMECDELANRLNNNDIPEWVSPQRPEEKSNESVSDFLNYWKNNVEQGSVILSTKTVTLEIDTDMVSDDYREKIFEYLNGQKHRKRREELFSQTSYFDFTPEVKAVINENGEIETTVLMISYWTE